ncbi:MAG: histone acetyltransferase, partial [Patescibacteria group bacterium]|nr:histone acetyltransferase [Patescibacteria group bacterium]
IRDFSSADIVIGNKQSNLRQIVEAKLNKNIQEIRSREIRNQSTGKLKLETITYQTSIGQEKFLQWVTANHQICAFLRLSLPEKKSTAMIRELHVYGQSLAIGGKGKSQHLGLGSRLLKRAIKLAAGYQQLSVISAVGTKEYYRRRGFTDDLLYQHINLLQ